MLTNYGCFGTHELWNNQRTYAYLTSACINDGFVRMKDPGCTGLPLLCDQPPGGTYTDPVTDEAPWYDPNHPESADFAGIWVEAIPGFDTLGKRDVTSTPFGSTTSRRKLEPKTLTVTAWLSGKTCCAVQYGYRWLVSELMSRDCITNAETNVLSMYDCCPTAEELALYETDDEIIEQYVREMYNVKVVDDPKIIERVGSCCNSDCGATNILVQWTFTPENPKMYRKQQLALTGELWPEDINCVDLACAPCDAEPTVSMEVTYNKTRYPISVGVNGEWCPLGNWVASDYFDNPDQGYLEVASVETQSTALQISVSYLGTWSVVGDWNPVDIDLCAVNIEIVQAVQGASVPEASATIVPIGSNTRKLGIELTTTSSTGGTWTESAGSWEHNTSASVAFPPAYSELQIINDCGCDSSSSSCEIIVNEDGTWDAWQFDYVGILPPSGCDSVTVRRSFPGTYTVTEDVPISQAFLGCSISASDPPTPFAGTSTCYCQPLEWVELAAQIPFQTSIERAEPYLEFYAGDAALYNFKAEFYQLPSSVATWVTDGVLTEDLSCVEPTFALQVGKSIPAESTLIFDPRRRTINLEYQGETYDYSAACSGYNGSSPYFIEFPECYGMVVVMTAEVHSGELPSSTATVTVGYTPFVYVGV